MNRSKKAFKKSLAGVFGGLILLSLTLSSCIKDNNSETNPATALVTVIQASPDEPSLDCYLNNDQLNQAPLDYGTGINYFSVIAGPRIINFYNYGTRTPVIATAPVNLKQNLAYSIFLDNLPTKPGVLLLTDTLVKPANGKAAIRFVNLSPDAPAVDLLIQGGATITANKNFEGYSSFIPVDGQSNFTLEVLKSGTSTVLATMSNVSFAGGRLYTVLLEGLNASTGSSDQLNIIVITNAYFN